MKYIDLDCPTNHVTQWCLHDGKWYYRFVKFEVLADENQDEYYIRKINWSQGTSWILTND